MNLESEIKDRLLKVVQSIHIHKIDSDNTILEIDYDVHTADFMELFKQYLTES